MRSHWNTTPRTKLALIVLLEAVRLPQHRTIAGLKFNALLVVERAGTNNHGQALWRCLCDCGQEKVYVSHHLTRRHQPVKTCGCKQTASGSEHAQWNGCGEISGGWWATHVMRSARSGRPSRQNTTIK